MYSNQKLIAQRIKSLREAFNLSIEEAAEVVGFSPAQYQEAEEGKVDFTFSFLHKLAKYYSVDIVELISGDTPRLSGFQIVRKDEGMPYERRKGFTYLHRAALFKDKKAEPFIVRAKYNAAEQNKPVPLSTHNDQEFNLVLKGKLKFVVDGFTTILKEGDTAYYNANLPHGMIAYEDDCEFLSVVIKTVQTVAEHPVPVAEEHAAPKDHGLIYNRFITPKTDKSGKLVGMDFHPGEDFNFAYDVVDGIAKKNSDKPAMLWLSHEKKERLFTFGELKYLSDKCANFFLSAGIRKGDRVMLVLKRHYQFWVAILALHKIGAVAIPATHLLTQKDFEYRINTALVSAIVCTGENDTARECEKALPNSPTLKIKIMANGEREGWLDFDSEVAKASSELQRIPTKLDDTVLMYFTSGTTGYPKIAEHSMKYALGHFATAKFWHNVDPCGLHLTISDTGWGKAVWGKLYGQWLCEAPILTYDFDKFEATDILQLFAKYNITTFCAPPTMYRFFIKEDLTKYDLSSLKYATVAGEALNPEVYEQFYKATGIKLMEGYGQTETTLTLANLVGAEVKPGSMGKPTPQYDIDLVDADGNSVKTGEVGEIVLRTDKFIPYGMFKGYYRDPEATARAWHDGLYHTGDTAWKDEDGYFWFVGRVDDVIKSSGYRIGPFEVESVLMEIPYILECAVTGAPDPLRGQVVKATIVLTKGKEGTEELKKEIQNYVKEHTAPYKYPRIIEFVSSLPKTISGKIKRNEIRNIAETKA
jgi:acetyl-CoA synthetase